MIRLTVRTDNAEMAANVGGAVHSTYKSFDYDLPEVEELLRTAKGLAHAQVVSFELLENPK
jgi:hypothetical protein